MSGPADAAAGDAADASSERASEAIDVTEDGSDGVGPPDGRYPPLRSAPDPGTDSLPDVRWLMPEAARARRGLAAWALAFSIAGLVVSLFVGWGFPIGLVGAVTAIVSLRRPLESRAVAVWALVLGTVSVLYSAGWLLWAASRTNLSG